MTVTAAQIIKAQAHGLVNIDGLAAACDKLKFPFYFACTIIERESPDHPKVTGIKGGANIFGHDRNGAFTDPDFKSIEVTEGRYKEFLRLVANGHTSNGVGPMQLTFKGYHIGQKSLTARGLKAWVPADNMFYGIEILANYVKHYHGLGMSFEKSYWHAARDYNNSDTYADAVIERSKFWLTIVGNADTKPTPNPGDEDMPITDADVEKIAGAVIAKLFTEAGRKQIGNAVWFSEILKPGEDNKDPNDKTWQPRTFLTTTYNRVAELLKKP